MYPVSLQIEVAVCSIPPCLFCIVGRRGAGVQRAWNSVAHRACGHIHCGLCLHVPWRPETLHCLLPGTRPFIHEKCPQLKKQPHTHRSTLCIQKEINSTYSPGTGKSHRVFGSASINFMREEFHLCSFFCCLFFWIFTPPCWASPHSTVLCCTQIFTLAGKPAQVPKEVQLLERSYPSSRLG